MNKFVQTKMHPKEVSKRFVRFCQICQICQICRFVRFVRSVRFVKFYDLKNARRTNKLTEEQTDRRTNGQTDPLIEMHGRI